MSTPQPTTSTASDAALKLTTTVPSGTSTAPSSVTAVGPMRGSSSVPASIVTGSTHDASAKP